MTRWFALRTTAAALVLALLFAFPAGAQLPGRQSTPEPSEEWVILGILEQHAHTGLLRLRPLVSETPVPPPTVAPSRTPTPTPSPTLTPTATVTHTPTPSATATPGDEPTQETTPPPSPPPSTDIPRVCEGGVATSVLNVRAGHSLEAGVLSKLYIGERVVIEQMYVIEDARREWAYVRHADTNRVGWVASYFTKPDGTVERYLVWDDESEWCWPPEMPVEWEGPGPIETPVLTAWGAWVGQGANTTELLLMGEQIKAAGRTPAAVVYGYVQYANDLAAAGWQVAYRPFFGDCMNQDVDPVTSARARWHDALRLSADVNWTWLVLNNECTSLDLWWYKSYLAETVRLAEAGNVLGVVPHVFASGFPELSWFGILQPEHARLAAIGGGFGLNSYPVREGMALCSDDTFNEWTTYRYRMFSLPDNLPIIITEYARSWGADTPDFDDISCYVRRVDGWPIAFATAWYAASPMHPWPNASLVGRLGALGQAYRAALL